jgi:hypothetical protein
VDDRRKCRPRLTMEIRERARLHEIPCEDFLYVFKAALAGRCTPLVAVPGG